MSEILELLVFLFLLETWDDPNNKLNIWKCRMGNMSVCANYWNNWPQVKLLSIIAKRFLRLLVKNSVVLSFPGIVSSSTMKCLCGRSLEINLKLLENSILKLDYVVFFYEERKQAHCISLRWNPLRSTHFLDVISFFSFAFLPYSVTLLIFSRELFQYM